MIYFICVYILSIIGTYKFIQKAYSKGGRWSNLTPDIFDLMMTFFPLANTFLAVNYILGDNFSKLFRIKK